MGRKPGSSFDVHGEERNIYFRIKHKAEKMHDSCGVGMKPFIPLEPLLKTVRRVSILNTENCSQRFAAP